MTEFVNKILLILTKYKTFSKILFTTFLKDNKMDLKDFFKVQSKEIAQKWGVYSPGIEVLNASENKKVANAVRSVFDFDKFKLVLTYYESGRVSYAQQTIWLSVSLEEELLLPYSIYDILAFCEPENFNCYTYTYVDSEELMVKCFGDIEKLVSRIAPKFKDFLSDGINKNRLITRQRKNINDYFGDDVLTQSEMVGGAADKIVSFMLDNFFQAQIESAVIGSQNLFYIGNEEKALKKLRKAKCKSQYQENLLKYLENGGKNEGVSEAVKEASLKKGATRHSVKPREGLKSIIYSLLVAIPISIIMILLYTLITFVLLRNSVFSVGFFENMTLIPLFALYPAIALGTSILMKKRDKKTKNITTGVRGLRISPTAKTVLKYLTIFTECVAVLGCFFCAFSNTGFYDSYFKYTEEDFPTSFEQCDYSSVKAFIIADGFMQEDEFCEGKHLLVETISGRVIDLYYSTYYSTDKIIENEDFFNEKGIEIKRFKTLEEYKTAK